jgi:methyltransferase (TIGR00027 family)
MSEIRNVSGTAFVVAEYRAEENSEETPLYEDHVVGLFLSEESRSAARRVALRYPPVKDMVKIRTKYFDDTLEKHLLLGCRQVVILGAGLDTRSVRKQSPGVKYFEIDDPATLNLKQARYAERGIDVNLTFIPANYVTDGLIELLKQNGFDAARPSYFLWEGNVMYLPLETVRHLFDELRTHVKSFRLSCDYFAEAVITKTTGDEGIATLVDSFAAMGAPWLSGIRDIQEFARELRLEILEHFTTSELFHSYRHGHPIVAPIFDYYSVCTLSS